MPRNARTRPNSDGEVAKPAKLFYRRSVKNTADLLEAMATFREVHYGWAEEYINKRTSDPRGTGGTPYMQWLQQLIEETRAAKIA